MPGHTSYRRQPQLQDRPHVSLNGLEPSAVTFNSGKSNVMVNSRSIVSTEGMSLNAIVSAEPCTTKRRCAAMRSLAASIDNGALGMHGPSAGASAAIDKSKTRSRDRREGPALCISNSRQVMDEEQNGHNPRVGPDNEYVVKAFKCRGCQRLVTRIASPLGPGGIERKNNCAVDLHASIIMHGESPSEAHKCCSGRSCRAECACTLILWTRGSHCGHAMWAGDGRPRVRSSLLGLSTILELANP
jgi:hypothetical protein